MHAHVWVSRTDSGISACVLLCLLIGYGIRSRRCCAMLCRSGGVARVVGGGFCDVVSFDAPAPAAAGTRRRKELRAMPLTVVFDEHLQARKCAVGTRADCHEAVATDPEGPSANDLVGERSERVRRLLLRGHPQRGGRVVDMLDACESVPRYSIAVCRKAVKPNGSVTAVKRTAEQRRWKAVAGFLALDPFWIPL